MGSVSRDIDKKGREYDGNYPYEVDGIAALLRDINKLSESRWYNGDIDATVLIVDLKDALDSDCLTPRMRQVMALYYFAQLTEEEIAQILGMQQPNVNKALMTALERVSTYMEYGYNKPPNARIDAKVIPSHPFLKWVNSVADGSSHIYSLDGSLTYWLASNGDRKAQEAINQLTEGYTYEPTYLSAEEEYPALTWDQFKWRDRRMSYSEDIYPIRTTVGFRKVVTKLEDDSNYEWHISRKRLFI